MKLGISANGLKRQACLSRASLVIPKCVPHSPLRMSDQDAITSISVEQGSILDLRIERFRRALHGRRPS